MNLEDVVLSEIGGPKRTHSGLDKKGQGHRDGK